MTYKIDVLLLMDNYYNSIACAVFKNFVYSVTIVDYAEVVLFHIEICH